MILQIRGYHDSKEEKVTFSIRLAHVTIKSNGNNINSMRKVVINRPKAEVLLYFSFFEADNVAIDVLILLTI